MKKITRAQIKKEMKEYNKKNNTSYKSDYWYVAMVCSEPDFNRQGYGKKIMTAADIVAGHGLQVLKKKNSNSHLQFETSKYNFRNPCQDYCERVEFRSQSFQNKKSILKFLESK